MMLNKGEVLSYSMIPSYRWMEVASAVFGILGWEWEWAYNSYIQQQNLMEKE